MAIAASNEFFNGGFQGMIDNVTDMVACSQQPTTYAEANATYALARKVFAGGELTEDDGSPDGRELNIALQTLTGEAAGTADHIALIDTLNSVLYYVTTCDSVSISDGVDQGFAAWIITVRDPT